MRRHTFFLQMLHATVKNKKMQKLHQIKKKSFVVKDNHYEKDESKNRYHV